MSVHNFVMLIVFCRDKRRTKYYVCESVVLFVDFFFFSTCSMAFLIIHILLNKQDIHHICYETKMKELKYEWMLSEYQKFCHNAFFYCQLCSRARSKYGLINFPALINWAQSLITFNRSQRKKNVRVKFGGVCLMATIKFIACGSIRGRCRSHIHIKFSQLLDLTQQHET